ncbi:MAG: hypothetical protein ACR2HP_05360 [Ilumatobacteraceae bacterium]
MISARAELGRVAAIARRDLQMERTYLFRHLTGVFQIAIAAMARHEHVDVDRTA